MIFPNPRHLRAFVALSEHGSFAAAAQAVHLGQPALSQAIAGLETLAGVRLLDRSTRSARLTPAGQEFLVAARRVLEANERLMQTGDDWARSQRGRIELLTLPSMAYRLLPALVRDFRARHPEVHIEVHDHADPVLRQRLGRGEGDLAIVSCGDDPNDRPLLPFLRDHFRVVLPAGHALARLAQVDSGQLASERLILLRRGALLRSYMDTVISRLTLIQAPIEVDQPGTLIGMVEAGLGISLLPAMSCPTSALQTVTTRPLARPEISRQIAFTRPQAEPMPAVQSFIKESLAYLVTHAGQVPEGCELLAVSASRLARFLAPPRASTTGA